MEVNDLICREKEGQAFTHGSIKPIYDEMLAVRPDIGAIFFSGYTEDILIQSGMIENRLAFLPKPFTAAKLAKTAREVLDT